MRILYDDRHDAGRTLAGCLAKYADRTDTMVLGLPRGGVVVAHEVADALHLPLDVFVVRKLGVPGFEELALGAIATGGIVVLNDAAVRQLGITREMIDRVIRDESRELQRRERLYRAERPLLDVAGRTAILVDDGLATGSTMRAAIASLRRAGPARIVMAVPVGPADTCMEMLREVDEAVCAATPDPFFGVGVWYENFGQVTDAQVQEILERAGARDAPAA